MERQQILNRDGDQGQTLVQMRCERSPQTGKSPINLIKLSTQFFLFFFAFMSLLSCKTNQPGLAAAPGNKLFKVAILYPSGDGKTFDLHYYETKHMPMVAGLLGKNLKFYEIDKGLSGRTPSDKVPYLAVGSFYIKDTAEYNKAIAQNRQTIINDFKNYTNIQPVIQISEVEHLGFGQAR